MGVREWCKCGLTAQEPRAWPIRYAATLHAPGWCGPEVEAKMHERIHALEFALRELLAALEYNGEMGQHEGRQSDAIRAARKTLEET